MKLGGYFGERALRKFKGACEEDVGEIVPEVVYVISV